MSALDRRWLRWVVRLVILLASAPAAILITFGVIALMPVEWQWAQLHNGIIFLVIPVLTVAIYGIGHVATSRWPWP
jgi:hypothetical protein